MEPPTTASYLVYFLHPSSLHFLLFLLILSPPLTLSQDPHLIKEEKIMIIMQDEQHKNHPLFCQHERVSGQSNFTAREDISTTHSDKSLVPLHVPIPQNTNYT